MAREAAARAGHLSGDLAMWFIVGIEMLTFGLFFVVFAVARARDPATFQAGQASLDLGLGAVNTVLLLTGSWCAARGVLSLRQGGEQAGARWLWSAAAFGGGFLIAKGFEYRQKALAGLDLETDTFWMLYYVLTGFHFLHVAAATILLAAIAWLAPRRHWRGAVA